MRNQHYTKKTSDAHVKMYHENKSTYIINSIVQAK
jgi:hypothetical protein